MMRIRKKSGELEDFDRGKLERSMLRAGASADTARRISERVQLVEGLSTDDLRRRVAEELQRENQALSGAYMSTRSLRVREEAGLTQGIARLNTEHLRGIQSDRDGLLMNERRKAEVRLQANSGASPTEIHLSSSDMQRLGVQQGSRIQVRYPQ
jgi:ATP cone domain